MTTAEAAARAARLIRSGATCLLCGGRPGAVGFWEPDEKTRRLFNLAPPRHLSIAYALCPDCTARPGAATLVEDQILADLAGSQ